MTARIAICCRIAKNQVHDMRHFSWSRSCVESDFISNDFIPSKLYHVHANSYDNV